MVKESTLENLLKEIVEMELNLFQEEAWNEDLLMGEIKGDYGKLYLIQEGGRRVDGYAIVRTILDEAEILRIGINRDSQGEGLGEYFLRSILQDLGRMGIKEVFLEVSEANLPAQRLYHSLGFRIVGERKDYYHSGYKAILMKKKLEEEPDG